jgi:hypothetical protein
MYVLVEENTRRWDNRRNTWKWDTCGFLYNTQHMMYLHELDMLTTP